VGGRLDEVQIETVARSAEWLRVDDRSMTDQVIRYSARTQRVVLPTRLVPGSGERTP
jgi:hypothetical protein